MFFTCANVLTNSAEALPPSSSIERVLLKLLLWWLAGQPGMSGQPQHSEGISGIWHTIAAG